MLHALIAATFFLGLTLGSYLTIITALYLNKRSDDAWEKQYLVWPKKEKRAEFAPLGTFPKE